MRDPAVSISVVAALGLTQIIGYGSLFYSFSILAPGMALDLGLTLSQVFGVFSASLFVASLSAPYVGRQMDRIGAARLMVIGSVASAVTLILCAWSPSAAPFAFTIVLLEISSGMVTYQAAFAALVQADPRSASKSITYLTLIAGFASTIFWPISTELLRYLTWREIYLVFAALNLFVCMPLHLWIKRKGKAGASGGQGRSGEHVVGAVPGKRRRAVVLVVSAAFALQGFTLWGMLALMVPLLGAQGLGSAAVAVGSLFGPAQVLSRLINMIFGTRLAPPGLAVISAALMVLGVVVLALSGDRLPGAVAFSICLGLGSGINSIAVGSLPLYLFGSDGYGALTGKMAAVRLAAGAIAPFAFAAAMEQFGIGSSLFASAALGAVGIVAFAAVALATKRSLMAAPGISN